MPLEWAVHQPQYINLLLSAGADLGKCKAIVRDAVWNEKIDAVRLLLQAGAPINEKHSNGTTALTIAIEYNYAEIFNTLIAAGADPNQKGDYLPLEWAVHQPQFFKPLLAAGADITKCKGLVQSAVWNEKIESVRILHTDFRADLNEIHPNGNTPIMTAVEYNYFEILGELLARGADPNRDANGALPLLKAADKEDPHCFDMLLEAGADVNKVRQSDGSTALMQAAYYGRTGVVQKLLARSAHVELVDKTGNSAMDYAANQGHDEIVMILLEGMS